MQIFLQDKAELKNAELTCKDESVIHLLENQDAQDHELISDVVRKVVFVMHL